MGVDVGAKAEIYEMLNQELAGGAAVLLVSSDLDEVAGICHRALIFNRGRIVQELRRPELSVARLTALVGGATQTSGSGIGRMDVMETEDQHPRARADAPRPEPPRPRRSVLLNLVRIFEVHGLLILTLLLVAIFSALLPRTFPTQLTAAAILQETSTVALLALGETIVIASGQFDLSIGYVIDICAVLDDRLAEGGSAVAGRGGHRAGARAQRRPRERVAGRVRQDRLVHRHAGCRHDHVRARELVHRRAADRRRPAAELSGHQPVPDLGIPLPAWYVVVFGVVFWAVLEFLPVGRYLYAVGSNRRAAELVGVRTSRYVIGAFVVSGLTTSFAGIVLASRLQVGQSSVGPEYLLPAFVGALLGATTIKPGRVNALGTVVAVLILAIGIAGLQQMGGAVLCGATVQRINTDRGGRVGSLRRAPPPARAVGAGMNTISRKRGYTGI